MKKSLQSDISKYILQSFNMFDKEIAGDLNQVINNLENILIKPFTTDEFITEQFEQQINKATYEMTNTERESIETINSSFGLEGSYGFFSAAIKLEKSSEKFEKSTDFSSCSVGTINIGTTYFNGPIDADILKFFKQTFVTNFKSIDSLQKAKDFVDTYGTHLALGWNLGGSFSIQIDSSLSSFTQKDSFKKEVDAAYKNVSSVTTSAQAAYELTKSASVSTFKQSLITIGGSATIASQIDITSKDSSKTINEWMNSCTKDTTYGLEKFINFADLAQRTGESVTCKFLKKYMDLVILSYSLENPTIFSKSTPMNIFYTTSVGAESEDQNPEIVKNYKIISGGAKLDMNMRAVWLTGSYPIQTSDTDKIIINNWQAESNGSDDYNKFLTAYAISIYDPGDLLDVVLIEADGTSSSNNQDEAIAIIPPTHVLVTGGCYGALISGKTHKFIRNNHPLKGSNGTFDSWKGEIRAYKTMGNVSLKVYAVGISCDDLTITQTVVTSNNLTPKWEDTEKAVLGGGIKIIGGGVSLTEPQSGNGNLASQSYPSTDSEWTEDNNALNGESQVVANAYAIGLTVEINGLVTTK